MRGVVRSFNDKLGYGFLSRDNGGPDVFVYYEAIQCEGFKTLSRGQEVEYDIELGRKGPQAANVRVIEQSEARRA